MIHLRLRWTVGLVVQRLLEQIFGSNWPNRYIVFLSAFLCFLKDYSRTLQFHAASKNEDASGLFCSEEI